MNKENTKDLVVITIWGILIILITIFFIISILNKSVKMYQYFTNIPVIILGTIIEIILIKDLISTKKFSSSSKGKIEGKK